ECVTMTSSDSSMMKRKWFTPMVKRDLSEQMSQRSQFYRTNRQRFSDIHIHSSRIQDTSTFLILKEIPVDVRPPSRPS
ncbi:MAG: hypothetical protein K6T83_21025, partial [Alicyclobacillus sp.]|nr:hypothetical protein [Alicyclobacillus sp.]